jgi:hypothetical protein
MTTAFQTTSESTSSECSNRSIEYHSFTPHQVGSYPAAIDEHRSTKSTRDINMLMNDPPNGDAAIIEYAINKVKRRYRDLGQLAAQMNRETWKSLSPGAQTTWDTLTQED